MSDVYILNESLLIKEDTPSKTFTLLIKDSSGNAINLTSAAVGVKLYSGALEKTYTATIVTATEGKIKFTAIREDLNRCGLWEMVVTVNNNTYPSSESLLLRVEGAKETVNVNTDTNGGGTSGGGIASGSYSDLTDKPKINGVTLNGNKTASSLGLSDVGHTHEMSDVDLSETTVSDITTYWNTLERG